MEIINPGKEAYHIYSINFSDGMNIIDEIVLLPDFFHKSLTVYVADRNFFRTKCYTMSFNFSNEAVSYNV